MNDELVAYWSKSTPMNFTTEEWSYKQKRNFRYKLQSYMHATFRFERLRHKYVLEVGCGSGIDTIEMLSYGAYVTAIDFTDNAINLTRDLVTDLHLYSTRVLKADVAHMPFKDGEFDYVYSYGVLHHIPDISSALQEISRVLTPKGTLLGMVYNKDSLLYQYSIIHQHESEMLEADQLACKYSERNIGCPYTHVYTKSELSKLLSRCFSNITIGTRFNVIDLPDQRKVKVDLPEGHPLGWHLVFEATK